MTHPASQASPIGEADSPTAGICWSATEDVSAATVGHVAISAGQWKRAISPALGDLQGWHFKGKFAYRRPTEWFALGVHGSGSAWTPDTLYVSAVWMPLFIPMEDIWMSHGKRVPNGVTTHRLDQLKSAATLALAALPSDESTSFQRVMSASPTEEAAYSLVLCGELRKAKKALTRFHRSADDPEWLVTKHDRMQHVSRLLQDQGADAVVQQLRLWRATTLASTGLMSE